MDGVLDHNDQDMAEPDLPQLPQEPLVPTNSRHAQIMSSEAFHLGTSSDPPAFSSDDVAPSAETYSAKRKKYHRIRPWWQPSGKQSQLFSRKKKGIQRNYDSGIFMGSEASFASSDIPESELDRLSAYATQEAEEGEGDTRLEQSDPDLSRTGAKRRMSETGEEYDGSGSRKARRIKLSPTRRNPHADDEQRVLKIVGDAVENGDEVIDLEGELKWVDTAQNTDTVNRLFHPLHQLIKTRRFDDTGRFEELIPDLRLFLNSNDLRVLPSEVYRLRNLTYLSLRNNKLRTLDAAGANWTRLNHLNLSSNRLRWVPAEIYCLPALSELLVSFQWFASPVNQVTDEPLQHHSTSQISYLDACGRPIFKSAPQPSETTFWKPSTTAFEPKATDTGCRSLIESCITAAAKYVPRDKMNEIRVDMADYVHLLKLIEDGIATYDTAGGHPCRCGRKFMVSRAEWFEWISPRGGENFITLLHRTCSWRCAQDDVEAIKKNHTSALTGLGWDWRDKDS